MPKTGALDQLQQVHELNRGFLGLLQARLLQRRSCLGLPATAHAAVASAGSSALEGIALMAVPSDVREASRAGPR